MYVCMYVYMWFHLKNTKCYMSMCFLLFSLNLRTTFNLNWGTGEEVGTVILKVVLEKQNCCYPYVGNRSHTMNKNHLSFYLSNVQRYSCERPWFIYMSTIWSFYANDIHLELHIVYIIEFGHQFYSTLWWKVYL